MSKKAERTKTPRRQKLTTQVQQLRDDLARVEIERLKDDNVRLNARLSAALDEIVSQATEAERFRAALDAIEEMEGVEGVTDYVFAKRALEIVRAALYPPSPDKDDSLTDEKVDAVLRHYHGLARTAATARDHMRAALQAAKVGLASPRPSPDKREEVQKVREALAFFACTIKSGEDWTDTCERVLAGAKTAIAALSDEGRAPHD